MSSFKNFAPMLSSLQAQADGTGTIAGSAIEDFLSIAGYETPGGGGGGSSDFSTATLTLTVTGGEDYLAEINRGFTFNGDMYLTSEVSLSKEFLVLLYKGTAIIDIFGDGEAPITDITGDFTLNEGSSNSGTMTGNCSMSILGFLDI